MRKTRKCPCVKGFGRFGSGRSDGCRYAPKPRALPSELHPELRDYYNGYGGKKQGEDSRGKFAAGEILNPLGGFRGAACSGIMGTKISGKEFSR